MGRFTKEDCIALLQRKAELLRGEGLSRFPQRSDFADDEVVAIKAFLGPWPRALEEAGLKEKRSGDRVVRNREKRVLAKRRRREAEKASRAKESGEAS